MEAASVELAVSAVTLAELSMGPHATRDAAERARRQANVETALYAQKRLLDDALLSLASGRQHRLQSAFADLTDDVWLYGGSRAAIAASIGEGRSGIMPAFGERLDATQIRLLTAWLTREAAQEALAGAL